MTQRYEDDGTSLEAVGQDHNRLPALVLAAIQDVERTDLLSRSLIAPLARDLLAHFHREEVELFPRTELVTGDLLWSETASLRREHLVLRELLGDIEASLVRRDRAGARGNLLELATSLRLHCDRENILYSQDA